MILDILHRLFMVKATSQTKSGELAALSRYAMGAKVAVEIGSSQGVSAAIIARSLSSEGILYCVDPWPAGNGERDPVFNIFRRHIARTETARKIHIIREFSSNALDRLPPQFDFAFIDGDHSWKGIETDWTIVSGRMIEGAFVCLHDTAVPAEEPSRIHDSCRFYDEVIESNSGFELIETVYSMRVLRKRKT
jgi:predicted O-methyltransferase YrrM